MFHLKHLSFILKQVKHPLETLTSEFSHWLSAQHADQVILSLIELLPSVAVFAVDEHQRIILWNSAAERLLGFKQAEVIGQHCLNANRCDTCMKNCGLKKSGNINAEPLVLYRADGSSVRVRKYAHSVISEDGLFAGGIEVLIPETVTHTADFPNMPHKENNEQEFYGMLSHSALMQQVFQLIRNVAQTEATVLVRGESGTGKELAAKALHVLSHRNQAAFMAINCATLSANLLESELFGHLRGAFTGAIKDHPGLFKSANHGTVFLDEVAELPLELQAKLLRFLQERSFTPVGGNQSIDVDVRIIAATHRSLREEVKAGRFREDLMYRLRVVPIFLPPLRERKEDIELLLWHFIKQHNKNLLRRIETIAPEAIRLLLDYRWPGNIRELQNVVEYAFAVGRGSSLGLHDLPPEFREKTHVNGQTTPQKSTHLYSTADQAPRNERERIHNALQQNAGKITNAAASLGMSRATFWRKRKQYGI